MSANVGDLAPDFTLPGTGGKDYTLSSYRGHPVVLVFYPGDNTAVCTTQLKTYTADFDEFESVDAHILAISPQDVASHEGFTDKHGFKVPLLADTDKQVGKEYGILGLMGLYRRSVFVVDAEGVLRYAHRAIAGLTYKPTAELIKAVRGSA